jgi:predicted MFS family arabinose efflux permease
LWRNRDFRLLWGGGLVNDTGDWLMMVALPLYVLVETGSGAKTAALFLCQLVPTATLGPWCGNLVDRWNLRRTIVATNVAQAVALLPLLTVNPDRVWPAFIVAAVQGVLTRLNNPASAAIIVRVVRADQLTAANSARAISENIARLVGSPLGGIVVAVGGLRGVVVVDGISFVVVAVATALVRADAEARQRDEHGHDENAQRLGAGLRVLIRRRPLRGLLAALTVSQISQGMFVILFLAFVTGRLHGTEADVGVIRGMQAVGGIIGGLVIGRFGRAAPPGRLLGLGFAGMAAWGFLCWNLPALTTAIWVYAALMALAGPAAVSCSVGMITAAQQFTPGPYLGLLVGTAEAAGAAGQAAGAIGAGLLLDRVELTTLLNTQATLYVITAAIALAAVRHRSGTTSADEPADLVAVPEKR